jgi:uncharacterized membrane protein (DUF2068 family)
VRAGESGGRLVWLIALERSLRGILLVAAGIYLIAKLGRLRKHEVKVFGAGAIAYGVLELVEGGGLFYRKRWAEWLTVIATSLLVPLEVYELVRHPSWLKAGGVAVNVAIVIYLYRVVRRRAR